MKTIKENKLVKVVFTTDKGAVEKYLAPHIANNPTMQRQMGFIPAPEIEKPIPKTTRRQLLDDLAKCATNDQVDELRAKFPEWDESIFETRKTEINKK